MAEVEWKVKDPNSSNRFEFKATEKDLEVGETMISRERNVINRLIG